MPVTNFPFIQQEMIRYGMSIYFGLGLAGNICNCIMFTRPIYRRTPSSVYQLFLSIFALLYLIWNIIPQLYTLYYTDPQKQSVLYCKVRIYASHVLGLYQRYIITLACMDRFFATRTNVRIRSLSSIRTAIMFIFITCIVCTLIAIHLPFFMEIRGTTCGMFGLYKLIFAFYQIIVLSVLPPLLMVIFSVLTIRSLYQRHATQERARQRDRHLLLMVIVEVIVNIFTTIPFSGNLIYGAATYYVVNKNTERLETEAFLSFFAQFVLYLLSVAPFYLFIILSKPFRTEFINILVKCLDSCMRRQTRILPTTTQTRAATHNGPTSVGQ